jgi:hypothetical protein
MLFFSFSAFFETLKNVFASMARARATKSQKILVPVRLYASMVVSRATPRSDSGDPRYSTTVKQ